MDRQLSFDLPVKPVLGRDDFFVSPTNALAVAMIDHPETWSGGKLALTGPAGSGKTHLAHVWASQTGARIISAADLATPEIPDLASGPVVIEDVPRIANDIPVQESLFHLHNLLLSENRLLLMTGQPSPNHWAMTLPDLQSRVQGAANAVLSSPDDALLSAVLAKLFADRQIAPKPDVIPYLVTRIDRSFDAAAKVVDLLDRASMDQARSLSRNLAAETLANPQKTA